MTLHRAGLPYFATPAQVQRQARGVVDRRRIRTRDARGRFLHPAPGGAAVTPPPPPPPAGHPPGFEPVPPPAPGPAHRTRRRLEFQEAQGEDDDSDEAAAAAILGMVDLTAYSDEDSGQYDDIRGGSLALWDDQRFRHVVVSFAEAVRDAHPLPTVPADAALVACCVCMDEMAPGQRMFVTPCGHHFHADCITEMCITRSTDRQYPVDLYHSTCPLCRGSIETTLVTHMHSLFHGEVWEAGCPAVWMSALLHDLIEDEHYTVQLRDPETGDLRTIRMDVLRTAAEGGGGGVDASSEGDAAAVADAAMGDTPDPSDTEGDDTVTTTTVPSTPIHSAAAAAAAAAATAEANSTSPLYDPTVTPPAAGLPPVHLPRAADPPARASLAPSRRAPSPPPGQQQRQRQEAAPASASRPAPRYRPVFRAGWPARPAGRPPAALLSAQQLPYTPQYGISTAVESVVGADDTRPDASEEYALITFSLDDVLGGLQRANLFHLHHHVDREARDGVPISLTAARHILPTGVVSSQVTLSVPVACLVRHVQRVTYELE